MLAKKAVLAILLALAPALPALAQQGTAAEINFQAPKPGMAQKYEGARKLHMGWHKRQKDAFAWLTWEVVSGERNGTYVTGSFGHAWKDFDGREKFDDDDNADFNKGIGPTIATAHTAYYVNRVDLSLTPPSADAVPAPFIFVTSFLLKPEAVNDFVEGVKKVNEGIKKTSYPQAGPSRWYQLVNGGEGPLFVLVGDRANWAAFAPMEKTLDAAMEEAYGKEPGAAILSGLRKSFRSVRTETMKYRPELSYLPAK